jgi:hypothetical protein
MVKATDDLQRLLDEYLMLSESPENRRRLTCWELEECARDQWHGRPRANAFRDEGALPITVDLQNTFWLHLFPQDLAAVYSEPEAYLRFHLQKRIAGFKLLQDDTPLDRVIPVYLSTPFETSLFGVPVEYFPDKDPIIDQRPIIHSAADLGRLEHFDFYGSGMMPRAHRLYEGVRDLAGDSFRVLFPEWVRAPFGVALYVRGYQDLLVDMVNDTEMAEGIMSRVTVARETYFAERGRYLGEDIIPEGSLFNDEVDASVISARHYRKSIMPHEARLGAFHGRISYWHSCGNTAAMAADIVDMGCVDLLDVSGWTDLGRVLGSLRKPAPRLERRLHPLTDLQHATPEHMKEKVQQQIDLCRNHDVGSFTLRVSGLQVLTSFQEDLTQVQSWIAIARAASEAARQH